MNIEKIEEKAEMLRCRISLAESQIGWGHSERSMEAASEVVAKQGPNLRRLELVLLLARSTSEPLEELLLASQPELQSLAQQHGLR